MQTDKITHATICYAITLTIGLFIDWWVGVCVALMVGLGKELYDKYKGNKFDWHDMLADVVGGVVGVIVGLTICQWLGRS